MIRMPCLAVLILSAAGLVAGENTDSLYQQILFKRGRGTMSIVQVDKSIALELQRPQRNFSRLSELFFYRGELLRSENRYEEAISAYTHSLNHSGEKRILEESRFSRGTVYETLGLIKSRQAATESLVSSQLFWFGKHPETESIPQDFVKAESDYRDLESARAKERLMELCLMTGRFQEAELVFQQLRVLARSDESVKAKIDIYEILLLEAGEDFQRADSLERNAFPQNRAFRDSLLTRVRTRRLVKPIQFEWVDETTRGIAVQVSGIRSDAEPNPFPVLGMDGSLKRLMFESLGGGFLVSGKASAEVLGTAGRKGIGADLHVLGTFLNKTLSLPGGGFSLGFQSFEGSGKRILNLQDETVSEKSESGFGLNLNGGIRHTLFVFASYNPKSIWLNDLSGHFSIAQPMADALGIDVVESRKTKGVYGMGDAGTGWWPEKTHLNTAAQSIGFNTHLNRFFSIGASRVWWTSDLTDQDELSLNRSSVTYVHDVFFSERISSFRADAGLRFGFFGLAFFLEGHHHFVQSSNVLSNRRSAQIVQTAPEPNGIHRLLLNAYGGKLDDGDISYARKITGYLPSTSRLLLGTKWSGCFFSVEYTVNGLRAKNREVRFSLRIASKDRFLSQSLHDLAPWK